MTDDRPALDRALELMVYAPVGMALFARDSAPTFLRLFVARGQTEIAQRRKQLADQATQWRTIGQLAVRFGAPHVRREAEARLQDARRHAERMAGEAAQRAGAGFASVADLAAGLSGRVPVRPARQRPPQAPPTPGRTIDLRRDATEVGASAHGTGRVPATGPVPAAGTLPIPGYDQLSASQVVERLDGLSRAELDAIRVYEQAHRGRNTILGKIAQLSG